MASGGPGVCAGSRSRPTSTVVGYWWASVRMTRRSTGRIPPRCSRQSPPVRPEGDSRMCDSHNWPTDPFAKGTWTTHRPGQLSRYYSDFFVPHGRLCIGGSDLARGCAGSMHGAIESGTETAAALAPRLSEETQGQLILRRLQVRSWLQRHRLWILGSTRELYPKPRCPTVDAEPLARRTADEPPSRPPTLR